MSSKINEMISSLPRAKLANIPTRIDAMNRLPDYINGPRIFVKRDDNTDSLGGNKLRKLEFLLGDAVSKGADTIITSGDLQSNHARLTATSARKLGLNVSLVLASTNRHFDYRGNLLLDSLLGADIKIVAPNRVTDAIKQIESKLLNQAKIPYIIPAAGYSSLGVMAYMECFAEILQQGRDLPISPSHIMLVSGSGTTQAGLLLGKVVLESKTKIIGISDGLPSSILKQNILKIGRSAVKSLGLKSQISPADVIVFDEFVNDFEIGNLLKVIKLVAKYEGIFLDPDYTAKSMYATIKLIRSGYFSPRDSILFMHTGGMPSLLAMRKTR